MDTVPPLLPNGQPVKRRDPFPPGMKIGPSRDPFWFQKSTSEPLPPGSYLTQLRGYVADLKGAKMTIIDDLKPQGAIYGAFDAAKHVKAKKKKEKKPNDGDRQQKRSRHKRDGKSK